MFDELIFRVAALVTIAAFLFEVWRYWKEGHDSRAEDGGEKEKGR